MSRAICGNIATPTGLGPRLCVIAICIVEALVVEFNEWSNLKLCQKINQLWIAHHTNCNLHASHMNELHNCKELWLVFGRIRLRQKHVGIFSALCLALQIGLIRNRNRWQRSLDCLLRWRSRNAAPMTDRLLSGSRNCLLDVLTQLRSTSLQRSVLCQPTNCCTHWFYNLSEKRRGVPWKRLPKPWFRVIIEKCLRSLLPFHQLITCVSWALIDRPRFSCAWREAVDGLRFCELSTHVLACFP